MNQPFLFVNNSPPWNYTDAEKIKAYYRNNPIDWNIIRDWLKEILKIKLQLPVPESPLDKEQDQYLSFTLQYITGQIPLLKEPDKAVLREELIHNGIKEPSNEDVEWLLKAWIDYVLYSHIETVFSLIQEHRDNQPFDWLLPAVEPYLINPQADAYLGVKILGDTFDVLGKKTLPLLDVIARDAVVPALAEQAEALRKLLAYREQTGK